MTITERLSAALSDRYRIERELGQGGMATVHLAEGVKHKRLVAPAASSFHILVAWVFAKAGLRDEAITLLERAGEALAGTLHGSWACSFDTRLTEMRGAPCLT